MFDFFRHLPASHPLAPMNVLGFLVFFGYLNYLEFVESTLLFYFMRMEIIIMLSFPLIPQRLLAAVFLWSLPLSFVWLEIPLEQLGPNLHPPCPCVASIPSQQY